MLYLHFYNYYHHTYLFLDTRRRDWRLRKRTIQDLYLWFFFLFCWHKESRLYLSRNGMMWYFQNLCYFLNEKIMSTLKYFKASCCFFLNIVHMKLAFANLAFWLLHRTIYLSLRKIQFSKDCFFFFNLWIMNKILIDFKTWSWWLFWRSSTNKTIWNDVCMFKPGKSAS